VSRIERLVIENFRGSSTRLQLEFDKSKPVVVVFGENGTGKTTIADAFDAISNNSKGSIGEKSSTRARDHLPTIGKIPADVNIELKIEGSVWKATQAGDNLTTLPQPSPKIRVLRRKHLQDLVEAQPAKRYEVLSGFIDVAQVEKSESTLKDAHSTVKLEYDAAVARRADIQDQLDSVWAAEGSLNGDAVTWAGSIAAQDVANLEQESKQYKEASDAIMLAETALEGYLSAVNIVAERQVEVEAVEQEVSAMSGVPANQAINLSSILYQVAAYLEGNQLPEECPVCKQSISLDDLKSELSERLEELAPYEAVGVRRTAIVHAAQVSHAAIEPKSDEIISLASGLYVLVEAGSNRIFVDGNIDVSIFSGLKADASEEQSVKCQQAIQLIKLLIPFKQLLDDASNECTRISGQVNSVRESYERLVASISESEHLESLLGVLDTAYNTARIARIEFTQSVLDAVAAECNQLYSQVHPGEPLAISKLELDQNRRASLNQAVTFEGHNDVAPQAYFSESHLDTLGFCFWLAIAKLESPDKDSIIVLDDVFTSVDAPHISRIAQLITDESVHFSHTIITTHDRSWRDIYRYARGPANNVQMIELQRWSLGKGISDYKTKLAVTDLVDALDSAPFDRQTVASKSGVLLEAILDHLALNYRCRVPRTPDNSYTLGELLGGTKKLLKAIELHRPKLDDAAQLIEPVEYVVDKVDGTAAAIDSSIFVRNQVGAHFNIAGAGISDNDVSDFAALAVAFANAISCRICGQIPSKKAVTHYECSCGNHGALRMFPLQL
jgi:energy-coupling factor transporter ATP-binding protein EcfA2